MNAIAFKTTVLPESANASPLWGVLTMTGRGIRAVVRITILVVLYPCALADAAWLRLVTTPTGRALAHTRAAWLHRWSRITRRVLGLQIEQRGFTPVSGIVVANYANPLDAMMLAALRPCVFVAGAEVRRWPIVGILARLGGTLFVDPRRRNDLARINFMIQRAVQRRLLVVIFPECGGSDDTTIRAFTSALFQPAVDLGCTLTATAISYHVEYDNDHVTPIITRETHFHSQQAHRCTRAVIAFKSPTFHHGNRKRLAHQLRMEVQDLNLGVVQAP